LEELCDRIALIKDGKIIDVVDMEKIKNPDHREYKIEFIDKKNFDLFKKESYDVVKVKENQNQVILKVNLNDISSLLMTLSKYQIKFITEIKYNLEKYFKEKFNLIEREGEK
ncbi:MAG TPA: ABC transporter ATP-binding protein, partial [Bacilli bacterium]